MATAPSPSACASATPSDPGSGARHTPWRAAPGCHTLRTGTGLDKGHDTAKSIPPRVRAELLLLATIRGGSFISNRLALNGVPVLTTVAFGDGRLTAAHDRGPAGVCRQGGLPPQVAAADMLTGSSLPKLPTALWIVGLPVLTHGAQVWGRWAVWPSSLPPGPICCMAAFRAYRVRATSALSHY
jgi:hypothetical protein